MTLPKISIIIASYNCKDTIERSIDSIISQTYHNWELIIIDGKSEDGTLDVIKAHSDSIAHYVSEPDTGVYNAWNKGLRHAQGEWICFLGADDFFWDTQVFEKIATILSAAYPKYRVVYGKNHILNEKGDILYTVGEPWSKVKNKFLQLQCLPHPGLMHHRTIFEDHGHFNENFKIAGDYELLLRELRSSDAVHTDLVIAAMVVGGLSSTPGNMRISLSESLQAQRLNNIPQPGIYWYMASVRGKIREFMWSTIGEQSSRRILDIGRKILGKPTYWTRT